MASDFRVGNRRREYYESAFSPAALAAMRFITPAVLHGLYSFRCAGLENVPQSGAAIIAPNHVSFLDPLVISYAIQRPVHYLAWHRLFDVPVLSRFIRSLGAIPVDIDLGRDRLAWQGALKLLRRDELLAVFPEGIRGYDGRLNPLKPGVARLALSTGAPLIPAWVTGTLEAWPRWRRLPRMFVPLRVAFGAPIRPPGVLLAGERQRALAELSLRLEASLVELSRMAEGENP